MKARICLDTSFLVQFLAGNEKAIGIWKEIAELKLEPVISVIVLFEIKRLSLKEKFEREKYEVLEKALLEIAELIDLDRNLALKMEMLTTFK
jgi:predicted nucleic acid-binding protein